MLLLSSFKNINTEDKIILFCGSNTKINFVGAEHNDTKNIFLLKSKSKRNIPRTDCNRVPIYNCPQTRVCQPKHKL